MALVEIVSYPSTYSGTIHNGIVLYSSITLSVPTESCDEIQSAIVPIAPEYFPWYYPTECNFINLSGTGTVFMQNPDTFDYYAVQVQAQWQTQEIIPLDSFKEFQVFEVIAIIIILAIVSFRAILWRE